MALPGSGGAVWPKDRSPRGGSVHSGIPVAGMVSSLAEDKLQCVAGSPDPSKEKAVRDCQTSNVSRVLSIVDCLGGGGPCGIGPWLWAVLGILLFVYRAFVEEKKMRMFVQATRSTPSRRRDLSRFQGLGVGLLDRFHSSRAML